MSKVTVDRYILLRYEDYERLISNQPNMQHQIDKKTLYHSNEGGLDEKLPVVQATEQGRNKHQSKANSGRGEDISPARVSETAADDNYETHSRSSPSKARRGEQMRGQVSSANWGDIWEGLHFAK